MTAEAVDPRTDELRHNLDAVEQRIVAACRRAGRPREEVRLIVVTKFFPVSDLRRLAGLGVRDIGENRDQEAAAKVAELGSLVAAGDPRPSALHLHFIGQLQTNKAPSVARYADTVQSVDRARLVAALDRGAAAAGRRVGALVQVNLDAAAGRGGVPPEQARALAELVAGSEHLQLRGVMAVAPLGGDPDAAFAALREVADGIRADHPEASWISAGMSADLEQAVANGATHLRVGTAILGSRPPLR